MITFALFRLFWAGNRAGSQFKGSEPKFDMSYFTNTIPGQLPVKNSSSSTFQFCGYFCFATISHKGHFRKISTHHFLCSIHTWKVRLGVVIGLLSQFLLIMKIMKHHELHLELSLNYWLLLKPGPAPWKTWTLKYLYPEKPGPWNTCAQKNQDPEKPGPLKTWTRKNLDPEKSGKQLDVEKWSEDHII